MRFLPCTKNYHRFFSPKALQNKIIFIFFFRKGFFYKIKTLFFKTLYSLSRNAESSITLSKLLEQFETLLTQYNPVFTFSIEKTSKEARKFSRGKVGPYKITWLYLRPQKRIRWILKWFAKTIILEKTRSMRSAFQSILRDFFQENETFF